MPTPCRFCASPLEAVFADLGMSPLANSYLTAEQGNRMEPFYPLRALVCGECFLVQLEEYESPDHIFSDYAYFSSYSSSWLEHSERYATAMVERFGLDGDSRVVEVASNDGYLLQYFNERGIPVLGIEPAANVAKVAAEKGLPTLVEFFGVETARSLVPESGADLLIGNNVLAHVPDINDFVGGMKLLLEPAGVITMEFPHLMRLIDENQWDTIYHEHFSYLSFSTARRVFAAHGLRLFDVEAIPTHGGSLRIYGCHAENEAHERTERADELERREQEAGLTDIERLVEFEDRVRQTKWDLLGALIERRRAGDTIAAYGAPAKGNTLLNYCGLRSDLIAYTADLNPMKQGRFLPGTHIPIHPPEVIQETKPDLVLILPWNLKDEISEQLSYVREWGARLAVPIPRFEVLG